MNNNEQVGAANHSVKRDCGTGVAFPASHFRAAAPYLQRLESSWISALITPT